MAYVDGFVIPIPKNKIDDYKRIAKRAAKIWREHGALEVRECAGDDLKVKGVVSFRKAVGAKTGETVFFSWIVYKSGAHRDRVNGKVMKDPRIASMDESMVPFDPRRMIYGGFTVVVSE